MTDTVNNIHISTEDVLITPDALSAELPVSDKALNAISDARSIISDIIQDSAKLHQSFSALLYYYDLFAKYTNKSL